MSKALQRGIAERAADMGRKQSAKDHGSLVAYDKVIDKEGKEETQAMEEENKSEQIEAKIESND